jgi:Transglycosylase-like domain/LysM domain
LGRHRKRSRIRLSRALPTAAPALAGVAAALCLAPQALADAAATQVVAHHAPAADTAGLLSPAQLLSLIRPASEQKPGSAKTSWYAVRPDDSLSAIAGRFYHNPNAWPVLYWANHKQIRWANELQPGEVLQVPVKPAQIPSPPGLLGPAAAPADPGPAQVDGATAASAYSGAYPGGAFGACVVAAESGGDAQVMNSSGHYGLYQFSASTWAEYGGNPADFGDASVAEQNQVFANALASGGESNWSAYDGC